MSKVTTYPLDFMRSRAAMAIYYANTHPTKSAEIIKAMCNWSRHDDPRELTRKECISMIQIAEQYGYKERQ